MPMPCGHQARSTIRFIMSTRRVSELGSGFRVWVYSIAQLNPVAARRSGRHTTAAALWRDEPLGAVSCCVKFSTNRKVAWQGKGSK